MGNTAKEVRVGHGIGTLYLGGHNKRNRELLSQVLNTAGYEAAVALSYEEVLPTVESRAIALVLPDVTGSDKKVWLVCQVLRSHTISFFPLLPFPIEHTFRVNTRQFMTHSFRA